MQTSKATVSQLARKCLHARKLAEYRIPRKLWEKLALPIFFALPAACRLG